MGQNQSSSGKGGQQDQGRDSSKDAVIIHFNYIKSQKKSFQDKKKKWEPPVPPPRVGRKQRKTDRGSGLGSRLPIIAPNAKCKLRLLKLERVKDYLLMEEEFVRNQERLKPQDGKGDEDNSKALIQLIKT